MTLDEESGQKSIRRPSESSVGSFTNKQSKNQEEGIFNHTETRINSEIGEPNLPKDNISSNKMKTEQNLPYGGKSSSVLQSLLVPKKTRENYENVKSTVMGAYDTMEKIPVGGRSDRHIFLNVGKQQSVVPNIARTDHEHYKPLIEIISSDEESGNENCKMDECWNSHDASVELDGTGKSIKRKIEDGSGDGGGTWTKMKKLEHSVEIISSDREAETQAE